MAVPKRKTSKSKNKMRQAGKGLIKKMNVFFDKDGKPSISHIRKKPERIVEKDKQNDNQQ